MKEKIEAALQEISENIFYGVGIFKGRDIWDCIIFGRRRTKISKQEGKIQRWFVAVVAEEEVPEDLPDKVIDALRKTGLKKTESDIEYGYVEKSGEVMVEICTMEFYKTEKRC